MIWLKCKKKGEHALGETYRTLNPVFALQLFGFCFQSIIAADKEL